MEGDLVIRDQIDNKFLCFWFWKKKLRVEGRIEEEI